jgi:hypothetical protein
MMTMYSNRFHTLSGLIRKLHDQLTFDKRTPPEWENQLHVLNNRTNLLKYTMGFAAFGFLFNMTYCSNALYGVSSTCQTNFCRMLYLYDHIYFFIFTRD